MAEEAKQKHKEEHPEYQYQPRKPSEKKRRMTKKKAAQLQMTAGSPTSTDGSSPGADIASHSDSSHTIQGANSPNILISQVSVIHANGTQIDARIPSQDSVVQINSNNDVHSYDGESLVAQEDFIPTTVIAEHNQIISKDNFWYDLAEHAIDGCINDSIATVAIDNELDSMFNITNFEFQANPAISDKVSELNPILGQELPNQFNSLSDYIDASGVQALFTEAQEELQAAATESMWTDPIRDIDWSDLH
jgi:hypothetical protein